MDKKEREKEKRGREVGEVVLDVYKDWTPEMIALLKDGRKTVEFRQKMSRINRGKTHSMETRIKLSKINIGKTMSEETRRRQSEAHLGKTYKPMSGEGRKNISEAHMGLTYSLERNESISKTMMDFWANLTLEEKEDKLKNSFHSRSARSRAGKSIRANLAALIPEEREERMLNSLHSPDARKAAHESIRKLWANLSPDEKEERLLNSLHSPEAIRNRIKALHIKPNEPERWVNRFLQERYPGEWVYNGDYSQGITIGRKIPDFVNINGKKEVIEVFGGVGFSHFWDDEKEWIKHYAKYGYKCRVIWEWDVWNPQELERILG